MQTSRIVLFGSRARGDGLPYSDFDTAVILYELATGYPSPRN
ncbi:MAG: hypothetical protein DRK00_06185 [Thermoprotei archaeon]|nr:MAG: hypothetical protein DRK00_06185 [Thermoprotei archaeon]